MKNLVRLICFSFLAVVPFSFANAQDIDNLNASKTTASAPVLQGATNGTIGPKGGADAVIITGIVAPPKGPKSISEQLSDLVGSFIPNINPFQGDPPEKAKVSKLSAQNARAYRADALQKSATVSPPYRTPPPIKDFDSVGSNTHAASASMSKELPNVKSWETIPASCGRVNWHNSLSAAKAQSRKSGKPVFIFEMMGRLDREFC